MRLKTSPVFASEEEYQSLKDVYSTVGKAKNTCSHKLFFLAHLGGWRTGLTNINNDIIYAIFSGKNRSDGGIRTELHDEIIKYEYFIDDKKTRFVKRDYQAEGKKNISEFICQRNYELIRRCIKKRKELADILSRFINKNRDYTDNAVDNKGSRSSDTGTDNISYSRDGFSSLITNLNTIMKIHEKLPESESEEKDRLLARVLTWLVIGAVLGRDYLDSTIIERGLLPYMPDPDQTGIAEKYHTPASWHKNTSYNSTDADKDYIIDNFQENEDIVYGCEDKIKAIKNLFDSQRGGTGRTRRVNAQSVANEVC